MDTVGLTPDMALSIFAFAQRIGNVQVFRAAFNQMKHLFKSEADRAKLDAAHQELFEAEAYEALYGAGSLLRMEHPFNQQFGKCNLRIGLRS